MELAERLLATTGGALDVVMFVNSGSEANDVAWRIARAATRRRALTTDYAYHGITEATNALTPEEWAKGEQPGHVATVPHPTDTAACTAAETTGGCSGTPPTSMTPPERSATAASPPYTWIRPLPPTASCRPLRLPAGSSPAGADAGRARGGRRSASRSRPVRDAPVELPGIGIVPDMVVMGKPMGNGFPVAALAVRSQLLGAVPEEVELFSTFGGNPVACAAALAVLAVIEEEGLVANAAKVGCYLRHGLLTLAERHPLIGDVRGEGLLIGVELIDETRGQRPGTPAK